MRNRSLTYTIGLAVVGLIIILLIVYVERSMLGTYDRTLPYITAIDNVKYNVTTAQLKMTQLLSRENAGNYEGDVLARLNAALSSIQGMYDNSPSEGGDFSGMQDDETRALLREIVFDIEKVVETGDASSNAVTQIITPATDSTAAVMSPVENPSSKQFDESTNKALTSIQKLEDHVINKVKQHSIVLDTLSLVSIVLLIGAFGGTCYWLFALLSHSQKQRLEHDARIEEQGRGVKSLSEFIEAISAGNYSAELALEGDGANLGGTLLTMRDRLRLNAEDDRKRNWSTSGLAQVGDILRVTTGSTVDLYDNIIKFVVRYTKSNQGGLFILNDEIEGDSYLELVACYAFERKKYLNKKIAKGEGLVGQCFLEGEKIYLLDVPDEYIAITSGLGGASPNALLLVPLKVNEKIFGVMELATFGKYDPHEIELVEKLTESIASTISAVHVSESTRLLLEKTQQQAEEMRAQEEEMRQNMEELEATQEEMRRKEKHIQNMLDGEKKRNEISHKNRQLIMDLTKNKDIQEGKWEESLEKITSAITRQLGVSRCSIWEYHQKENKLKCAKLYQQTKGLFESGQERSGREYPGYFEAITSEEIIVAKDASIHQATREFSGDYYRTHNIQSVLSVPFFNEGKIAGIICCEQQHEQKEWSDEDIEFLKACADLITVAYNTSKINAMLDQLSDDQETMQTIIDNIPRAVFWKDKDLRFQGCNRIFANVAGLKSPADLIGKTDYEMPWKEHGDAYREDDLAVMNSRKARLDLEERNVNSEGVESWVLTSKVPVMNKHAEVVAVLGMFEDITERKSKQVQQENDRRELLELRKLVQKRSS